MTPATIVIVRPARNGRNRAEDLSLVRAAARAGQTWAFVVGPRAETRRKQLQSMLGQNEIAAQGRNVFDPESLALDWSGADPCPAPLANALAAYLVEIGFPLPLRQADIVQVHLPRDVDALLLAAVVEAAGVYPQVDIRIGEDLLKSRLRWQTRRDLFRAPRPTNRGRQLVGDSNAFHQVRDQIERYASSPLPVLVVGETGTGKEIVAENLHALSGRAGRFLPQNAAQLPPDLADSLLFGHEKGAFTGAVQTRKGRIREAADGTFFLDEVFNLHPLVQGKLLRALNDVEKGIIEVESVGGPPRRPDKIRARLVVSALSDPRQSTELDGGSSMRQDLYFRVAAGVINLPALRQCLDDLPALCDAILGEMRQTKAVEEAAFEVLRAHDWPGNVRELRLVLLRALMDAPAGTDVLSVDLVRSAMLPRLVASTRASLRLPCDLQAELRRIELNTMRQAREMTRSNAAAGRLIGMDPQNARNFGRRLKRLETQ